MRVCVYCSSSSEVDEVYNQAARELGRLIGEKGHTLVYGGCNLGLMGKLGRAVKAAGGRVVGIIPQRLKEYGLAFQQADEMIVVESMAERKALMEKHAEAFVALPGGLGTLDELLQVLTLKQLGFLRGAVVLLNVEGFYELLLAHFEELYAQRFAKPEFRALYHVVAHPAEALEYLEGYQDVPLPRKWFGARG
jgi:hypothetical protein